MFFNVFRCLLYRLDYESSTSHRVVIRAYDAAYNPHGDDVTRLTSYDVTTSSGHRYADLTLYVNVTDDNDNAPTFDRRRYEVDVDDDVDVGTIVATVNASDDDAAKLGRVTYSIDTASDSSLIIFNHHLWLL